MKHKWIVLVGDEDSGAWSVAVNSDHEETAREFYDEMRGNADTSPAIVIYTGDFVTV